jgi:hypothetical protein
MKVLRVLLFTMLRSDMARQYPPGQELAKGGQTGGLPYPNGQEKAHNGNGNLAHDFKDDRTK